VQAAAGDVTGDAKSQVEGRARQSYGEAQQAIGNLKDALGDTLAVVQNQVREAPLTSLLIAGALGWLIGRVVD
jgi:uncharacterized protein YjbJ (UPF0337 family)